MGSALVISFKNSLNCLFKVCIFERIKEILVINFTINPSL